MSEYEKTKRGDILFKLILVAATLLFVYSLGSSNDSSSFAAESAADGQVLSDSHIADLLEKRELQEQKEAKEAEDIAKKAAAEAELKAAKEIEQVIDSKPTINSYETPIISQQNSGPIVTVNEEIDSETGVRTITTTTNDNGTITTVIETITPGSSETISDGLSISQ